jgi:hypothetical protein
MYNVDSEIKTSDKDKTKCYQLCTFVQFPVMHFGSKKLFHFLPQVILHFYVLIFQNNLVDLHSNDNLMGLNLDDVENTPLFLFQSS